MMRLPRSGQTARDSVVPMINVAFLLLVFFLMTAVLAPPEPLEVLLPEAEGETEDFSDGVLVVDADGGMALGPYRGEAVFASLPEGLIAIRADAGLDAAELARLVGRLAEHGVSDIRLVTVPRGGGLTKTVSQD